MVARFKGSLQKGGDRAEYEGVAESEMYVEFVIGSEAKASGPVNYGMFKLGAVMP